METDVQKRNKLVEETWMPLIERAAVHYKIPEFEREDFCQNILVQVLEKYYAVHDPTRSKLNTFVFAMVRKRSMSLSSRRGRDAMRKAKCVGEDVWLLDTVPLDGPDDQRVCKEFWELVSDVRDELRKLPPRRARRGEDEKRTVLEIFDLLAAGNSQLMIAKGMGYSQATVSVIVKKIKKHPSVIYLKEYYYGSGDFESI